MQRVDESIRETRAGRGRRLWALFRKEGLEILRDPSSILITIVLPLLLIILYGSGLSLDLNHLRVGLVVEDLSPEAESFVRSITNSPYFEVQLSHDRKEIVEEITKGNVRGMLVVPSYFTQWRNLPSKIAPIQVIADGSETNTAHFVHKYAQGAFANWLAQLREEQGRVESTPLIHVEPRFWYNEEVESRWFLLPGSLSIIMTLIGALLTALVVAREWERGTMEMLISTPVRVCELVIGKIVPYFVLGMISMGMCVIIALCFYQVPLRGSLLLLGGVSALFLFCSLGLGLMISTLTKNQVVAYQITLTVGFFPAYILSGFLFEITSMPKWIQCLTYLIPARYFVQNLQTLFLVGNVGSFLFLNTLPILGLGTLFFLITAATTTKRLE